MQAEFYVLIFGAIFIFLIVLCVSFYVMAIYCHPEDKGFGASIFCKVLVVYSFSNIFKNINQLSFYIQNIF